MTSFDAVRPRSLHRIRDDFAFVLFAFGPQHLRRPAGDGVVIFKPLIDANER